MLYNLDKWCADMCVSLINLYPHRIRGVIVKNEYRKGGV